MRRRSPPPPRQVVSPGSTGSRAATQGRSAGRARVLPAAPGSNGASSVRTSAGSSRATNSRACSGVNSGPGGGRVGLAEQQPAEQVHRHGDRAIADVGAAARQAGAPGQARPPSERQTEKQTRPDRLVLGAPSGAGDAGDANAELGVEAPCDPLGQRVANLGRDRAEALDQLRIDAGEVDLGLVGVDDPAAQEVGRGLRRDRSAWSPALPPCTIRPPRSCAR